MKSFNVLRNYKRVKQIVRKMSEEDYLIKTLKENKSLNVKFGAIVDNKDSVNIYYFVYENGSDFERYEIDLAYTYDEVDLELAANVDLNKLRGELWNIK